MNQTASNIAQEVLAVIGLGISAFGIWQIYQPAAYIFLGLSLLAPFVLSIKRVK